MLKMQKNTINLFLFAAIFFVLMGVAEARAGAAPIDAKIMKAVIDNRDFFSRFKNANYVNHHIYNINARLGGGRIGLLLLAPSGIQETVVFDKKTGQVLYRDMGILKKEARLSILKRGISVADACSLARNPGLTARSADGAAVPQKVKKEASPNPIKTPHIMSVSEILAEIKRETGWVSRIERMRRQELALKINSGIKGKARSVQAAGALDWARPKSSRGGSVKIAEFAVNVANGKDGKKRGDVKNIKNIKNIKNAEKDTGAAGKETRAGNCDSLVRDVVANRDFFLRLKKQGNSRVYSVNTRIGENCIGVVFLVSNKTETKTEATVFDKRTGEALYRNAKKISRKEYSAMLGNSLSVEDANFLAWNIASIRERDIPREAADWADSVTLAEDAELDERGAGEFNEYELEDAAKEAYENVPQEIDGMNKINEINEINEIRAEEKKPKNVQEYTAKEILEHFKRETGWISRIERRRLKRANEAKNEADWVDDPKKYAGATEKTEKDGKENASL